MDEHARITLNALWYALLAALLLPLPDEVRRAAIGLGRALARALDRPLPQIMDKCGRS